MDEKKLQKDEVDKINTELKKVTLSEENNKTASGYKISNNKFLHKGGQAYVYRLLDRKGKETPYVLKVYSGRYSECEEQYEKFEEKSADIIRLGNKNILVPQSSFIFEDRYIVIEEYHTPLEEYKSSSKLNSGKDELAIAIEVADCLLKSFIDLSGESKKLEYAIYHFDVKPDNILMKGKTIDEGFVLTDFGVAAYEESKGGDTMTGIGIGGSLATMSPECKNQKTTALRKSDMYSIGMTLYYYLSGCYPGGAQKGDEEIHEKRLQDENFRIDRPAKGSEAFKDLVMKAISYHPENRYATYTEMYEALKKCEEYSNYILGEIGRGATRFTPVSDKPSVQKPPKKEENDQPDYPERKIRETQWNKFWNPFDDLFELKNGYLLRPYCEIGETPEILYEKIKENVSAYFSNKYSCKFDLTEEGIEVEFGDDIDFASNAGLTAYYERYINIFKELLHKVKVNSDMFQCSEEKFENCNNLQFVEILSNVKTFDHSSFRKCKAIRAFKVESGNEHFWSDEQGVLYRIDNRNIYFSSLDKSKSTRKLIRYPVGSPCKEYRIHEKTDRVDIDAFSGCRYLETLVVPKCVRSLNGMDLGSGKNISEPVLRDADSLKKIKVEAGNPNYSSDSHGVLFNKDKTIVVRYPANASEEIYKVPNTVRFIERDAFSKCFNLKEIIVTKTLQNTYGEKIQLNLGRIKMISSGRFAKNPMTPGRRAKIRKRILIAVLLLFIGQLIFKGCQELINNFDAGLGDNGIFWMYNSNKNRLTVSAFAYGSGEMDNYSENDETTVPWYDFKDEIKEVVIQKGVYQVGENSFRNCRNLEHAEIGAAYGVGYGAFEGCTNLKTVEICSDDAIISEYAFYNCEKFTDITIPSEVTYISENSLWNTGIYNDESNWDNGALYVNNHLIFLEDDFYGAFEIREGTTTIADYAFSKGSYTEYSKEQYDGITTLTIPSSVENIGALAFYNNFTLEIINVSPNNEAFYSDFNGVLFAQDKSLLNDNKFDKLLRFPPASTKETYTIPEGVSVIGCGAFQGCGNLEDIVIPEGVRYIEERAFEVCTGIKTLTIPASVKEIDFTALFSCFSLEKFVVDEDNKEFISDSNGVLYRRKNGLFSDGKAESVVKFPKKSSLTSFSVPDGTSVIESNCFADADLLETITLPDSIEKIEAYAFEFCDRLSEITIPKDTTDIDNTVFYDSSVEKIRVSGVTEIDREVLNKFIEEGIEIETY